MKTFFELYKNEWKTIKSSKYWNLFLVLVGVIYVMNMVIITLYFITENEHSDLSRNKLKKYMLEKIKNRKAIKLSDLDDDYYFDEEDDYEEEE